jgi:hypothetical protein
MAIHHWCQNPMSNSTPPPSDKIVNLEEFRAIAQAEEVSGLSRNTSLFIQAMIEAFAQSAVIHNGFVVKSGERALKGLEPHPCFNAVCSSHSTEPTRHNFCKQQSNCWGCSFQMTSPPPSELNYDEYMPNHQEALDLLEANGLLNGPIQESIDAAQKYYLDKPKDFNERMETEVNGLPMWKIERCIKNAFDEIITDEHVEEKQREILYYWDTIISRIALTEIEKALGIFPNIKLR